MARSLAPDDLYRLRIPTDPRLSPDGSAALVTLQTSRAAPATATATRSGSCRSRAPAGPRQLTIGAKHDRHGRFSPDGRTVAFLSRPAASRSRTSRTRPKDTKEREDGNQVHLLSLDGGEARRLTDLPRGVEGFEWSPDGSTTRRDDRARAGRPGRRTAGRAASTQSASRPTRPSRTTATSIGSSYMFNGSGSSTTPSPTSGSSTSRPARRRRLTDGPTADEDPAWSPDGTRIAFADAARTATTTSTSDPTSSSSTSRPAAGRGSRADPSRSSSCRPGCPTARRSPRSAVGCPENGYRNDIWLFAADGSDATPNGGRNISDRHDIMPGSGMNSDITPGEAPRLIPSADGALADVPRPDRRRLPAVADRDRRREARAADRRPALHLVVRPGRPRRAAEFGRPISAPRRPSWPTSGSATASAASPAGSPSFNEEALADVELRRAAGAPRHRRRPRHPGLVHPGAGGEGPTERRCRS